MKNLVINLQNIYLLHKFIYLLIEEHIKTFDLNTEGLAQNGILYIREPDSYVDCISSIVE